MKFQIKMSQWGRGNMWSEKSCKMGIPSLIGSCLYDAPLDLKCCLGFRGDAAGISLSDLRIAFTPAHCDGFPEWMFATGNQNLLSSDAALLMRINDTWPNDGDVWGTDEQKIAAITEVFARHGEQVEFIP